MIANIDFDPDGKYVSCFHSGSRPMLAIMLPFRIKADVNYHASFQDQGRCVAVTELIASYNKRGTTQAVT
jgi:hypothetical protein